MESLRYLYKIGKGPSSSHTMGPNKAAELFKKKYPEADFFRVILYGSLSETGKGHKTDEAVLQALEPTETEVVFAKPPYPDLPHENTLDFFAYRNGKEIGKDRVISIGGGNIRFEGQSEYDNPQV